MSVARRVAQECDCELGQKVGYAVRFEERASGSTRIKYLTGTYRTWLATDQMQLQPSKQIQRSYRLNHRLSNQPCSNIKILHKPSWCLACHLTVKSLLSL